MKQSCITIMGAGQIGSRHLQALCHLENPTRIDLVDPSDESLKTGEQKEVLMGEGALRAAQITPGVIHAIKNIGDTDAEFSYSLGSIAKKIFDRGFKAVGKFLYPTDSPPILLSVSNN